MAKTTDEIIAENKARRAEEAEISAARDAIHEAQMKEVGDMNAARTEAVLNGTSEKLVKTQEIVSVSAYENLASSPILLVGFGFLFGAIVAIVFFNVKIKQIKKEYETRLNEARSSLDRMLKIATKD